MPGTEDQKAVLLNCVGCHTLERVVRSTHDVNEWMQVVYRMANYAQVSQPIKPQKRMDPEWAPKPETFRKIGGVPRLDQPERTLEVGVSAQDLRSSDRQDADHRIRPAAPDHRAP